MSRHDLWREGEVRVISVTPVSRGVVRPLLLTVTTFAIIIEASGRYSFVHRVEDWLLVILVAPLAAVTATRVWRWRSHKVHVTNARVIVEGGVLRHRQTSIELHDVLTTRVDQRLRERFTRRGYVYLDTMAGPIPVGLVRHPSALTRLIDAERLGEYRDDTPLDTIFTYEDPEPYEFEVRPDEWRPRRFE